MAVAKILHNLIVLLSVLLNLSVFGSTLAGTRSGTRSGSMSGSLSIYLSVCIFTGLSCYWRVEYFSFVQWQQVQQEYCVYFLVLPHGVAATCVFNPHRCRCLPSLSLFLAIFAATYISGWSLVGVLRFMFIVCPTTITVFA